MNKIYKYGSLIILISNIIFLSYAFPTKFGETSLKLEDGYQIMEATPRKMKTVSDKLIENYPDLPENVRLLIYEMPSLEKERFETFSLFYNALSGVLNIIFCMGGMTVLWIIFSLFYLNEKMGKK